MAGPEFFQTGMGHKFYGSDVPRIANALERIADALERLTPKQAESIDVEKLIGEVIANK